MSNAIQSNDLETLAAAWLSMAQATTLDALEATTLSCLLRLVDADIAYTARRKDAVWTISENVGLTGNIGSVAVPEELVPYAEELRAGRTVVYESAEEMGPGLADMLSSVGL